MGGHKLLSAFHRWLEKFQMNVLSCMLIYWKSNLNVLFIKAYNNSPWRPFVARKKSLTVFNFRPDHVIQFNFTLLIISDMIYWITVSIILFSPLIVRNLVTYNRNWSLINPQRKKLKHVISEDRVHQGVSSSCSIEH